MRGDEGAKSPAKNHQQDVVVLPSGSMAGASGDPQVYSSRTESDVGVASAIPGECRAVLCCANLWRKEGELSGTLGRFTSQPVYVTFFRSGD